MLISQFSPYESVPLEWYFNELTPFHSYNNNICCADDCADELNLSHGFKNLFLNVNNNSSLPRKKRGRQTTFHRVCAHPCLRLNLSPSEREENFQNQIQSVLSPPRLSRSRGISVPVSIPAIEYHSLSMGSAASNTKSPSVNRSSVAGTEDSNTTIHPARPQMPERNEQLNTSTLAGGAQQSVNNNASPPWRKNKGEVKKENVTITPTSNNDKAGVSTGNCTCTPPVHRKLTEPPSYEAYSSLKTVFSEERRELDYVQGDGNCFFRALSKEIYGSEDCHYELRQTIVDLMSRHQSEFEQYTDTCTQSFSAHLDEMRQFANWATTAEIYAASTLLQRDIYVFSPDHTGMQYSWLHFSPCFPHSNSINSSCPQCYITLCHTNGNHYDRVAPEDGSCNCSLPPPELSGAAQSVNAVREVSNASLYALNDTDENRSDRTQRPGE